MRQTIIPGRASGSNFGRGWRSTLAAFGLAIIGAALVAVALTSSSPAGTTATATCAPRVIEVDLSSAARSPKLTTLAQRAIEVAAGSAVVCRDSLNVDGVSGGGEVTSIVTSDDVGRFMAIGPNVEVRSERFGASEQSALDLLITRRLSSAYKVNNSTTTSIAALYDVAAQQATPATDLLLITTGVNQDGQLNLNEPLRAGQGYSLEKSVSVPSVSAHEVTVVGIAQVDSSVPPPSAVWPSQILAFNTAMCNKAVGVKRCHLYDIASVSQTLNP